MKLIEITHIEDIKQGDLLLIKGNFSDGLDIRLLKVEKIKTTIGLSIQIILNFTESCYFDFDCYISGKSWVSECYKVEK